MFISNRTGNIIGYLMSPTKPKSLLTWCFRCHGKREIIDPKDRVTKNNRILWEGTCDECEGKLALMSGYAKLPSVQFGGGSNNESTTKKKKKNDTKQ